MTTSQGSKKLERQARLQWVPLAVMNVSPMAQRDFKQSRVDRLLAKPFDPEQIGFPTVNRRVDGSIFWIDGQHRTKALIAWLGEGNWEDQSIQCQTYDGLTEEEEAEVFLQLNDTLSVTPFDKFRISVTAGRKLECDVDRIVRAHNLRISRNRTSTEEVGTIFGVSTLLRIYERSGAEIFGRTLRVAWDAYGQAGLESTILDGIGLLLARHPGVDDKDLAEKLSNRLGVTPLLTSAEEYQQRMRKTKPACIAAAAIDIFNRKTTARKTKLTSWWKAEDGEAA